MQSQTTPKVRPAGRIEWTALMSAYLFLAAIIVASALKYWGG